MWRQVMICLVLALPLQALALTFDGRLERLPLGAELSVLEDAAGTADVVEVLRRDEQFRPAGEAVFNAGYTRSAFWLRLELDYRPAASVAGQPRTWLLELAYPPLDEVELYRPAADGGYRLAAQTGDTLPLASRLVRQGNYLFPLELSPGRPVRLYLRLQSQGSIQAPLTLWSPQAYIEDQPARIYALGMIYGVLLVMLVYNLLLYLALRLRSYLYYVGYIASFGLYQVSVNGAGVRYLWPDNPWWANAATPFLIGAAILFGGQFARLFLETPQLGRRWDWLVKGLMVLGAATSVLALTTSYGLALRLATGLALLFTLVMPVVGWVAWSRGMRAARCFIIAWSAFLLGGFINTLMVLGFLPNTFFTMYASQIGSALEVGLLSLALADRIKHMRHEREQLLRASSDELAALNAELVQANRLKDEFLSTLSHELRTPMNGVLGGLELLGPDSPPAERAEYLALADGSARRMLRMVDNLLALTELRAGRMTFEPVPFSLRALLDRLRVAHGEAAREKGLRLELRIDGSIPDGLCGDADKLNQALTHLLDNAIRFTDSGEVSLRVAQARLPGTDLGLQFDVIDSGTGLAMNEALYDPFRQADASMSRRHGGLGIGLSLARQLARLQGGDISHRARSGRGSCFTLTVPVALAAERVPGEFETTNG